MFLLPGWVEEYIALLCSRKVFHPFSAKGDTFQVHISADQTGLYGSQGVSVAMDENICIWICLLLFLSTPEKVNVFPWSGKDDV